MVAFLLWRPIRYRGERGLARNVQPRMMAFSMSEEEDQADDMDMMVCAMSAPPPALPVMDTATAEVKISLWAIWT